uniref:Uncharacterized protein n=1 Tax=Moniliophthora roreri TaxID=221103 RepID=A0A0W0FNE9_MONRR
MANPSSQGGSSDSDNNNVPTITFTPFTIPGGELTNADAQKCIAELQSWIDILCTQDKKGQYGQKKQADIDSRFNHDTVVLLGKKYSVMIAPWVDCHIFSQWPDANSPCPDASKQFDTDANFLKGAVIEFHKYLGSPELCKLAVEYPAFKNAFQKQTNAKHAHTSPRALSPQSFIQTSKKIQATSSRMNISQE